MRFIQTAELKPGMIVARDLVNGTRTYMVRTDVELTESLIELIKEKGYQGLYIKDKFSEDVEINETISQELFQSAIEAVSDEDIGSMVNVATKMVSEISYSENMSVDLFDLRSFDDYTYHHSVNVAVLSTIVGKKLGLSSNDLNLLAQAAICHDLGKSKIPEDVLNKPGKLTDAEFKLIQNHPRYTFDILSANNQTSALVKQAALCHHENENGTGYPFGKVGDEIPYFARIIHAVDVYDALTSKRPYKEPYAPADAFEYLISGKEVLFNSQIVDTMLTVIPAYPPGIDVFLSNGETAMVISHTMDGLRPKIKIFETGRIVDLSKDADYAEVKITKSGIMPQDYVGEVEMLNEDRLNPAAVKEKILVVDDQILSLRQITDILETEYEVAQQRDGVAAIKYIVENGMPDLIIMDIEMPKMNGYDTVKKLHQVVKKMCPVIFLTATNDISMVVKCKELGAADYILKPTKPIYLMERVARALRKRRED